MKLSALPSSLDAVVADLLVVCVIPREVQAKGSKTPEKKGRPVTIGDIDRRLGGEVLPALKRGEFVGEPGASFTIGWTRDSAIKSVLFYGAGAKGKTEMDRFSSYRALGSAIARSAQCLKATRVSVSSHHLDLVNEDNLIAFLEGLYLAGYRFDTYQTDKKSEPTVIEEVVILGAKRLPDRAVDRARAMTGGTALARDLINMPPNECTPPHIVKVAREVASAGKLKIQVYDKAQLKKMGANTLLAVSHGTSEPPFLVKMTYVPAKKSSKTKVVSIVGKGITFDSGGLCIKPDTGMESMKADMSGAAAVIGIMKAIAVLKPSVEVRAYIPTTENMINGHAMRPGDIVTSMSGKTVEILNTDAEGRLILADALTMASRDGCDICIDLATLTGACVVALGLSCAGLFTDDDKLAQGILAAAEKSGERYWRMPLITEYRELLKSKYADMKNIGIRWGGSITAALFLKEFVSDCSWAHLDIAGPADTDKDVEHLRPGGVGFGVRTMVRYILAQ